jgi:hypothetical protein
MQQSPRPSGGRAGTGLARFTDAPENAMNPRTSEQAQRRQEGTAQPADDKLPTYQELLDTAVEDTFPASDPISPSAALHTGRPVETPMDDRDWKLEPAGGEMSGQARAVVAEFGDTEAARRAQAHALSVDLPTARLDLAPEHGPSATASATLTVVVCTAEEQRRAERIAREAGARAVAVRAETH